MKHFIRLSDISKDDVLRIEDVTSSRYFAGYNFKKYLMDIQQAIVIFCMQEQSIGV